MNANNSRSAICERQDSEQSREGSLHMITIRHRASGAVLFTHDGADLRSLQKDLNE